MKSLASAKTLATFFTCGIIALSPIHLAAQTEERAEPTILSTFEKVWYRSERRPSLFKAFEKSGTLIIGTERIEFHHRRLNLYISTADVRSIRYGTMRGDGFNSWAVVGYEENGTIRQIGFKDGKVLGHGPDTPTIHDALRRAVSMAQAQSENDRRSRISDLISADPASLIQLGEQLVNIVNSLEAGETPEQPMPEPEEFESITKALDEYIEKNPDDVRALILFAQLGRMAEMSLPIPLIGGEMPANENGFAALHSALDHALTLEPNNPEAHYWQARLYGIRRPSINEEGVLVRSHRDLNRAVFHANRAVESAPNKREYAEALAIYLAHAQRYDDALDVLSEMNAGTNLIYRILLDMQTIPLPELARYLPLDSASFAELQMNRGRYENYPDLRVRMYAAPVSMTVFEQAFQQQWPDFHLYEVERFESDEGVEMVMFAQVLRWIEGRLQPATTRELSRSLRRERDLEGSTVMISIMEILDPTEEIQSQYDIDNSNQITILTLMNVRTGAHGD